MIAFDHLYKDVRDNGRQANMGGVARDSCPYMEEHRPLERAHWLAGWDEGQQIRNTPSTFTTPTGQMQG